MKTVIVQKDSGLIVEDQHGMLCVFINRDKAVSFMENRLHDLPTGLEIVDCSLVKPMVKRGSK